MRDPLTMKEIPDYTLTIPVADFQAMLMAQVQLNDIRVLISTDPRDYGHLEKRTEEAVEALLCIERKEKTA